MENFIKHIVELAPLQAWMFILFGIICAVFIFGILMMIIKKKGFPVGASTAAATVLAAIALTFIGQIRVNPDYIYFNLFIIGGGAILSIAGGLVTMITTKKRKKEKCAASVPAPPAPLPVNAYAGGTTPFTYKRNAYEPSAPIPETGNMSAANLDVEALLNKINRICTNGAPLTEMRETAMQLQSERAKPENKNNPETYGKLNKALLDLLNVIQKR